MGTRGSSSDSRSDCASGLDTDILQLVSSKLDSSYVPGGLHLSSTCRAWHAAAGQTSRISLTWDSRHLPCDADFDLGRWGTSFKSWLLKAGPQLDTLVLEGNERLAPRLAAKVVCAAVEEVTQAEAAAGNPLPLQQLQLPATLPWRPQSMQAASLVAALPHLRRLSVSVEAWGQGSNQPAVDGFLAELGGLQHLTSLELTLVRGPIGESSAEAQPYWEALLGAAPKQLQYLAIRLNHRRVLHLKHAWAPLAVLPHLKQLQLGRVWARDLSPLAGLPALTHLGLEWGESDWEPLVAVKGVLRELDAPYLWSQEQQDHLKQLTCLTSLRLIAGGHHSMTLIPEQVASRLQRLYLPDAPNTTSKDIKRLAHCSSSNLRDLQLWGWWWMGEPGAAEAVQQLTGLTSFSLLATRAPDAPYTEMGTWRALLPTQHLKQLRSLALPAPLLATDVAWLGGLPLLTSLRLLMEWTAPWRVEEVFGGRAANSQVMVNLRSCWGGLKVLEVELTLSYLKAQMGMQRADPCAGCAGAAAA